MTVTILGGGIGGLVAALACRQNGLEPQVLERAPGIAEVGAGVQISPNGAVVLRALGLGQALEAAGMRAQAVRLINGETGGQVARLPMTAQAYYFLHRADLIDILLTAAQSSAIPIHLGREAQAVDTERGDIRFADGTRQNYDMLIGADGVHSVTRSSVCPGLEPRFTGQVAWRATIRSAGLEVPEVQVHMGAGRHLVRYPLRGGRLINLVGVEERAEWAADGWHHEADPATFANAFAHFPAIQNDLARLDKVHLWGLHLRPVAQHWHKHGLVLLGDAAHPTLPFLAQGANMALEDAWVLAACLADGSGPARYEALRKPRTTRITDAARANARNYHLAPGPKRTAAHTALRLASTLAPGLLTARFNWLYDHDVTRP